MADGATSKIPDCRGVPLRARAGRETGALPGYRTRSANKEM